MTVSAYYAVQILGQIRFCTCRFFLY